ncbi:MAG: hypothetical protein SFT94_10550 [Pseudanabaenaceae cyanobacterium bins.68]|nr:hypothetical protein [Pseudanabaenaceae cyanobacterium bins.68]
MITEPSKPVELDSIPNVGDLREFYSTFGGILFYFDHQSGDAGKYLAPPSAWGELQEHFSSWLEILGEDEREEILPNWIGSALVIGETPRSGDYILIPTEGEVAGHVFEFDHDGFEFHCEAESLATYIEQLLQPSSRKLTEIASHMRFMVDGTQWWIRELRDNYGHVAQTNA